VREQQGHKGLERMGFDGAAIEKLRHLNENSIESYWSFWNNYTKE